MTSSGTPQRRRTGPKLEWVVADGSRLVNVRDFKENSLQRRPQVMCPQCGQLVTMKLGALVVPHAAHRPGDLCAATAPETALHLNAKFHLAAELEAISCIDVHERCRNAGRNWNSCPEHRARRWLPEWNRVEVELTVGGRRPDITLLRDLVPVGAIEVCVTNPVDGTKAAGSRCHGIALD